MAKTIITLGREYCTGGRYIAKDVARALGIKLYDKELITMAAKNSGLSEEAVAASEKRHTHSLLYSLYTMGNDLPLGDQVFILQSRIIKQLADEGPCVIVGRCGFFLAFSLICILAATQKISNKKRSRSDLRSSLFFKISPFFFYSIHTESLLCTCAPVYLSAFFHKLLQKNTAGIHDENKKTVCVFSDRTFPSDAFFPGNRCHRCRKRTAALV